MRIHLIGVCGTAMATLAALLKHRGHDVSGSDEHVYPPMSDFLSAERINVLDGYRAEHLAAVPDLVGLRNAKNLADPAPRLQTCRQLASPTSLQSGVQPRASVRTATTSP